MKKTSIYLTDREIAHLAGLARVERRPQAEIIRDAIAAYPGTAASSRTFAIEGIGDGPGDSVADLTDDDLLRGFGEDAAG